MNLFNTIRLKFSNFFSNKKSKIELNVKHDTIVEALSMKKELELLQYLSGISKMRTESAVVNAYQKLLAEEVNIEYNVLKNSAGELKKIREKAKYKAICELANAENALAIANVMDGRNRKIQDEKNVFQDSWSKYAKKNIRKRDPRAKDFAKFLIKYDYIESRMLDEISVTALFSDNKIVNFNEFRIELKRVNKLEPIAA